MRLWRVLGVSAVALMIVVNTNASRAMNGPSWVSIDGGPLGPLEVSAGVDGYFYAQSGTSSNSHVSIVGGKSNGAELSDFMVQLRKSTGIFQFKIQLAEYTDINLGTDRPKGVDGNRYTTGPLRAAYITIAPADNFSVSVGQLDSLEGYESAFAWSNPVQLRTVIAGVENSESRGVSAIYTQGPLSGTVIFGDGNDTGVFNYLQFLATDTINSNNNFNVFGGIALGVTGPNTFAYGSGGLSSGGANGVGGQGMLANVNSNVFGAWYSWTQGNLTLVPEVQFQYAKALHKYAAISSGGVSDNIPKETSNFAAAIFSDYNFGTSPFSLGAWAEYGTSHGSAAQDVWFVAPNAQIAGFAIAPTWQYKYLFSRINVGYAHLLNSGTPPAGYGNMGRGCDQVIGTLEAGLVF